MRRLATLDQVCELLRLADRYSDSTYSRSDRGALALATFEAVRGVMSESAARSLLDQWHEVTHTDDRDDGQTLVA